MNVVGIDLGIKNLGWYEEGIGFKTYSVDEHENLEQFSSFLSVSCHGKNVYVDFGWNEIYLPGRRLTQAQKYFLAGSIYQGAHKCVFVSPAWIREMFDLPPKTSKKEVHVFAKTRYPWLSATKPKPNQHELDAFLLYEWGKQNEIHGE